MTVTATAENLLALADQCVMCGLCLPHCPTYALAQDEAESPRGRIAMARAIASERVPVDAELIRHLDQCLGCRSCETACPSGVAYEKILVGARALIEPHRPQRSLLHRLYGAPRWLSRLAHVANAVRAANWLPTLLRFLPPTSTIRRLAEALPPRAKLGDGTVATLHQTPRSRVALLEGCVASAFDRDTLNATRQLLHRLGHAVLSAAAGTCCGALPRHAGSASVAATSASTRLALLALKPDRIAISASGCHGSLTDTMSGVDVAVVDAISLIAKDERLHQLRFRPLQQRAALHLPCSQVNGSGSTQDLRALLSRIPNLTVLELPTQPRCCGAAGSYFLEQPAIADRLRDGRLDQVEELIPDLLLTSNIGCRIHLGGGLRQRGSVVPVLHPLTLLVQQLEEI